MDLLERPCSADDSFEFIDFPDMANKTEEPPPGKLQTDPKISTLDPVPSVVGSKESQTDKDCKSVNLCNDDKTSSQNSNVPNEEDLTKGHQDTPSCSSCSCDQSVSSLQNSDDQVDQSECMCSKDKPVSQMLGSYAAKKPTFLSVNVHEPPDDDVEHLPTPVQRRGNPLCAEVFKKLFDKDGRLVDEHAFRKCIFMGGVEPDIRKEAWQFLFGLYPCTSTSREREELLLDYIMKYHEMKSRWKTMLVLNAHPGATLLQQGLVARYQIEDQNNTIRSPDHSPGDHISEYEMMEKMLMDGKMKAETPDFKVLSKNFQSIDVSSPEMQQKMDFMKIQAQVYVNRQKIDVRNLWNHLRVIDKDVPRTDRDLEYFKGTMNPSLTVLRNILLTFVAFHPTIGYAQGMNDILAQFLVVFDSELLGDAVHVSKATAGRCIRRVASAIANAVGRFIRFPTGQEALNVKRKFHAIAVGLRTDPGRACQYVVACVVLHNVGILRQDIVTLSLDDLTIAGPDIQEIGDPANNNGFGYREFIARQCFDH
uniref:Rab-GAP TBC domain-containing protein n=1 Tax=Magallana gigas TaxID=29159 RepID=A0A8W8NLK2_MAGGI